MSEILSGECKVLLQLLAKGLFNCTEPIEWEAVELKSLFKEAKAQSVIGIAFDALPKESAKSDAQAYNEWQSTAFAVMKQTLQNNFANVQITNLLQKNNIPHSTIKGYASANYYPNSSLRQMGDIDFLIYEKDLDKTRKLLIENGYIANGHDHELHIGFSKDRIIYELHLGITNVPPGKEFVLESLDKVIEDSIEANSMCGKIVIPSAFHHGVIMLLHMQRHMVNGSGIGLRHLCDWALFVNSFSSDDFVATFENELKKIGLWHFAKAISKTSAIYLRMPEKDWFASADNKLARDLINDIFDGGNFGTKNELRSAQQVFIDRNHHGRNIVARIFSGITEKIYKRFPFYKKYKILLPIGYIVYFFSILLRIVFKKNRYNIIKVYKQGNEQFDTYTRLKFFEVEK